MSKGQNHEGQSQEGTRIPRVSGILPTRIIIHGHHPHEKSNEGRITGKFIHLPESVEGVLTIAEDRETKTCFLDFHGMGDPPRLTKKYNNRSSEITVQSPIDIT